MEDNNSLRLCAVEVVCAALQTTLNLDLCHRRVTQETKTLQSLITSYTIL